MNITDVRIELTPSYAETDRLRGFASITIDNCFVVRDLKIIEGPNGLFVSMPSRKSTDKCLNCGTKNHLQARFCNECGKKLPVTPPSTTGVKPFFDIAHPINVETRAKIHGAIIAMYSEKSRAAK